MNVFLAHPSGNQFFRHLAQSLAKAHALAGLASCLNWGGSAAWWGKKLLPRRLSAELERRSFGEDWATPMLNHPFREAARLAAQRMGWKKLVAHESGPFCVDAVYQDFDRWLASRCFKGDLPGRAVYAYEDAAFEIFSAAKSMGKSRIYDLPIAYWETGRRLMSEEAERHPAWQGTLGGGIKDSEAKCDRKRRELELANLVVVPSTFVAESLPLWAKNKPVVISPFGSPHTIPHLSTGSRSTKGPLRVLFAGSMGQRKGLADLFEAIRGLHRSDVELVVLGSPLEPLDFYRSQLSGFTFEAGRPHREVLQLMSSCHVFCLPSIVEGRALVMQEAMSQGLPLIITPNTGGEDLIEEGITGFLLPIRSPDKIAEKIDWCADHREALVVMSQAAMRKAAEYTWESYGHSISSAIQELLQNPSHNATVHA